MQVSVTQNVISDNTNFGVSASGSSARVRLTQNTVVRNNTGLQGSAGPNLFSPGNNYVRDNMFSDGFNITADSLL